MFAINYQPKTVAEAQAIVDIIEAEVAKLSLVDRYMVGYWTMALRQIVVDGRPAGVGMIALGRLVAELALTNA